LPSPIEPVSTKPGSLYLKFPVSWELIRSGFNSQDVALEAENYFEYWAIYYINPLEIYLLTPRGKAQVIGMRAHADTPLNFPDFLAISELELSRLLGLESEPLGPIDQSILIELPIGEGKEQSINLKSNLNYFISVHLSMSF
jgi:hypothetical protein